MPHRRSPSPTRTLSLFCCQTKAWKAGHKGECVAAARADTRTAVKPTADQMRVLKMLAQLAGAADWRGVAAQERAARAVAAAVRTSMPDCASIVYCTLGNAYNWGTLTRPSSTTHSTWRLPWRWATGQGRAGRTNLGNAHWSMGDFYQAISYHTQCLAIAKEVGDRAGEGRAYGSLGNAYESQGDSSKAIEYHAHLAIAKEVGDRAGEGAACAYQSLGDFSKAIEYHAQDLAIAKEVGNRAGGGRAYGNLGNAY